MNNRKECINNDIEDENRGNDIEDENGDNKEDKGDKGEEESILDIGCISERGDLLQTDPGVRDRDWHTPANKIKDAHSNGNINNDLGINKNILRNIDVDRKSTNIKNSVVCDKSTHVKYNTNIDI